MTSGSSIENVLKRERHLKVCTQASALLSNFDFWSICRLSLSTAIGESGLENNWSGCLDV
jgi:hypothetical protein